MKRASTTIPLVVLLSSTRLRVNLSRSLVVSSMYLPTLPCTSIHHDQKNNNKQLTPEKEKKNNNVHIIPYADADTKQTDQSKTRVLYVCNKNAAARPTKTIIGRQAGKNPGSSLILPKKNKKSTTDYRAPGVSAPIIHCWMGGG